MNWALKAKSTFPVCRCDYGYFRNAGTGECSPCRCSPLGSTSDQCDAATGQCPCADPATVTGRDCSQCSASRSVLTAALCRNCDDGCVGELLDDVENVVGYFNDADVSDIDPAPMLRLIQHTEDSVEYRRQVEWMSMAKDRLHDLWSQSGGNQLKPQANLALLEAKKNLKSSSQVLSSSNAQMESAAEARDSSDGLFDQVRRLVDLLRSLEARGPDSEAERRAAMREIQTVLAQLERGAAADEAAFGRADIAARRELSHSRRVLSTIEDILFGDADADYIDGRRKDLNGVERRVNDLLQVSYEPLLFF